MYENAVEPITGLRYRRVPIISRHKRCGSIPSILLFSSKMESVAGSVVTGNGTSLEIAIANARRETSVSRYKGAPGCALGAFAGVTGVVVAAACNHGGN